MLLGGLQKNSLIDYPGKISCVLFVSGCNFHCPYCHNPDLATGTATPPAFLTEDWFLNFLDQRKAFLEGVVISGGEPTLQKDIVTFMGKIKQLDYPVKIDTNGSNPRVIQELIEAALVDFVAMDIKTNPDAYTPQITDGIDPETILSSIRILMTSPIDYEFRTTCVKPLTDQKIIERIAGHIEGADRYVLQQVRREGVLDPAFFEGNDYQFTDAELLELKATAAPLVKTCEIR